jgi:hypothetical protein
MATRRYFSKLIEENPDKYPAKMGAPWSAEEETRLLASIAEKKTLEQISIEHERKAGGIKARLHMIARRMYEMNGKGVYEIMEVTGLDEREALKVIGEPVSNVMTWSKEEMAELLKGLAKGQSIAEIAAALGRPPIVVEKQRMQLAVDYHEIEKLPVEDIQELLNLTKEEVEAAVRDCAARGAPKKVAKKAKCVDSRPAAGGAGAGAAPKAEEPTLAELMVILKEVQGKLDYILSKME